MPGRMILCRMVAFAFLLQISAVGFGQTTERKIAIQKIDPPNWWVEMPAPMLLVRGDYTRPDEKNGPLQPGVLSAVLLDVRGRLRGVRREAARARAARDADPPRR